MTGEETLVLQAIRRIAFEKETSDTVPSHALSVEVARLTGLGVGEVDRIAGTLAGKYVHTGKSLNYNYYRPIVGTEKKR